MKKLGLCIVLAFVVVLAASGSSQAGICLDSTSSCNDFYLGIMSVDPPAVLIGVSAYEYGCGYNDRLAWGSLRIVGGVAYIGLGGTTSGTGDNGQLMERLYVIDLSTASGSVLYNYFYQLGGTDTSHGGSGSATMGGCSPPDKTPEAVGPDESSL